MTEFARFILIILSVPIERIAVGCVRRLYSAVAYLGLRKRRNVIKIEPCRKINVDFKGAFRRFSAQDDFILKVPIRILIKFKRVVTEDNLDYSVDKRAVSRGVVDGKNERKPTFV